MTLGDLLGKPADHLLGCKKSRKVIGLNGASECFVLFLNVRAPLRGKVSKHDVL